MKVHCLIGLIGLLQGCNAFHFMKPIVHRRTRAAPLSMSVKAHQDQPLPDTTLVLKHPSTGATVYIVGCVHGSEASEDDVRQVIKGEDASVVVLELCQSRYDSMELATATEDDENGQEKEQGSNPEKPSRLAEFAHNLSHFTKNYGILQTMLVALLQSSAEVQRFFAKRRTCEFRTSVALAKSKKADIVLGDQDLGITLNRFKKGWSPPKEFKQMAMEFASIRDALLGPGGLSSDKKVNVLTLLFTKERYIREILKIIIPIGAVVLGGCEIVESIGSATMASINDVSISTGWVDPAAIQASTSSFLESELLENIGWSFLHTCTLYYALSINRYILVERDIYLAQSIAKACNEHPGEKVAAVVGLLHGNGVSRHLTNMGFELVSRNSAT